MKHKNVGRFKVTFNILEDKIDIMEKIMCECVPVKAVCDFMTDSIEYTAISNHFRHIEGYEIIPEYDCIVSDLLGHIKITFEERK